MAGLKGFPWFPPSGISLDQVRHGQGGQVLIGLLKNPPTVLDLTSPRLALKFERSGTGAILNMLNCSVGEPAHFGLFWSFVSLLSFGGYNNEIV